MTERRTLRSTDTLRRHLLTGASVAVIALASAAVVAPTGAWAQNVEELSGTPAAPAFTAGAGGNGAIATGEAITNTTATNAVDAGAIDVEGDVDIRDVTVTEDAQIFVFDGTNTNPGALSFAATAGDVFVVGNDDTFTISLGMQNSTTQSAEEIGAVAITADQGINGGDAATRGGTLVINSGQGADIQTTAFAVTFFGASDEAMLLTGLDISGADGEAPGGAAGAALNATVGNDQNDTVDVNTVTFSGGNASDDTGGADGEAGGGTTSTITADTTIATLNVLGGNGGNNDAASAANNGGAGGAALLTVTDTDGADLGAIAVTGGDGGDDNAVGDGDGGAGGNATLIVATASVTPTATTIAISGGADGTANGGVGGNGGTAEMRVAGHLPSTGGITLTDNGSSATLTLNGGATQTITGTINGGAADNGTVNITNTAAPVTFGSNIGATHSVSTITVADDAEAVFDGTVAANAITVTDAGNATSADFNAALTIGAGNLGIISGGAATATATVSAAVGGTGDIVLDQAGEDAIVDFDGTDAFAVDVEVRGQADGEGLIIISNTGGVTFNNQIGDDGGDATNGDLQVDRLRVDTNAIAIFNDDVAAVDFEVAGEGSALTFNAMDTVQVIVGEAAGGILTLDDGTINLGRNVDTGDTLFNTEDGAAGLPTENAADGGIALNLSANFLDGSIALVDAENAQDFTGSTVIDAFSATDTALTDFTVQARTGATDILEVAATARTAAETAALLGISVEDAIALRQAVLSTEGTPDNEGLDALTAALNTGGTGSPLAAQAAQTVGTQEDTLGGASDVAFTAFGDIFALVSGSESGLAGYHMFNGFGGGDLIVSGPSYSAPAMPSRNGSIWGMGFGGIANADGDTNFEGYDANYGGIVIGVDGAVSEDFTIGAFGTYFMSTVDGDGAGNSEIDANTFGFGAYANYDGPDFYLDAFAAYGISDNDLTRTAVVNNVTRNLSADYDASQFSVGMAAGVPMEVSNGVYITPNASLTWNHYDADTYTETGGGGFNQTVNPDSVSQLTGTIGARIHAVYDNFDNDGTVFIPELRLSLIGDLIDDDATASALFTGAGATAYQVTGTDTDNIGALVGIGFGLDNPDWSAALNYDADIRGDFMSHTARAEFRWKF
ncbi:MAG: autotransporter domain-containing protein [Cohaesibacteraceae bacterium]